jgi:tetratricopeptide (TPR) repeat protein
LNTAWVANANAVLPEDSLIELALAQNEESPIGAEFLRQASIKHLPQDQMICTHAAKLLLDLKDPAKAVVASDKALTIDSKNPIALRAKARVLDRLNHVSDAFDVYQVLLKTEVATSNDFVCALRLATKLGQAEVCQQIFDRASKKFTDRQDQQDLYRNYGWLLFDLNRPGEGVWRQSS